MSDFVLHPQPPIELDWALCDDIAIKSISVPKAGTYIPQHSHAYDHMTMLAHGAVRVWIDGRLDLRTPNGVYIAPKPIEIEAGAKHLFLALEDNTLLYCIHNVSRTGQIEVEEEHQIVKGH